MTVFKHLKFSLRGLFSINLKENNGGDDDDEDDDDNDNVRPESKINFSVCPPDADFT